MVDRILVKFPKHFEYFLPAVSVVHEYFMQVQAQKKPFIVKIELGDENQLFFTSLFPRMEIAIGGEPCHRNEWDCVLDLRDVERPYRIAKATNLHLTAAWGILFGGSPGKTPNLGYLGARVRREETDVLVDCQVRGATQLAFFFRHNYPKLTIKVDRVNGLGPATMFDKLCGTKVYIGERSGATYLAATMGKYLVELYPDYLPSWWLSKPPQNYRLIYGKDFSPELIWAYGEEIWQTLFSTKCQDAILTAKPVSTADNVVVR